MLGIYTPPRRQRAANKRFYDIRKAFINCFVWFILTVSSRASRLEYNNYLSRINIIFMFNIELGDYHPNYSPLFDTHHKLNQKFNHVNG